MASTPHPAPKPEPPPPRPRSRQADDEDDDKASHSALVAPAPATGGESGYPPTIGVRGQPISDGADDPDTIAGEQRRRSDAYVAAGAVEAKKHVDETGDVAAKKK